MVRPVGMAATAKIKKGTLKLERERAELSYNDAARNVTSDPERLRDWEEGDTFPSFAQAKKLAKKFRVPFWYLFLGELPDMALGRKNAIGTIVSPIMRCYTP